LKLTSKLAPTFFVLLQLTHIFAQNAGFTGGGPLTPMKGTMGP